MLTPTCDILGRPWYERRAELPCPVRRTDVTEQALDDEVVLFNPHSGSTFRLNATALAVWRRCDPDTNTLDIARDLHRRYDVSLEQAQDDVEQLLALFTANQLLQ